MSKNSNTRSRSKIKKRSDTLVFTAISDENGNIKVDIVDSQVLINGEPAQDVKLIRSYPRLDKTEKIISSIYCGSRAPQTTGYMSQWSPNSAVFDRFDLLLAVDTNTKLINGSWISVTSAWITEAEWKKNSKEGRFNANLLSRFIELHEKEPQDPEARGWYTVLNFGLDFQHENLTPQSVGLIVDSNLGEHDLINTRALGYFSKEMLPTAFSLVHASDAAADSIINSRP